MTGAWVAIAQYDQERGEWDGIGSFIVDVDQTKYLHENASPEETYGYRVWRLCGSKYAAPTAGPLSMPLTTWTAAHRKSGPVGRTQFIFGLVAVGSQPFETLDLQEPEDILGADRATNNHLAVSSGHRAHYGRGTLRCNRKRKHQRHIAGKPRNSKR